VKHSLKQGLTDYLELLQFSGVTEFPAELLPVKILQQETEPPESVALPQSESLEMVPEMSVKNAAINLPASEDRHVRLKQIAAQVAKCRKCAELAETRTQTVFGDGNPYSELVFLGEAPGADEDRQGVPFVGRAGKLLTDIITKGMKLNREDVYICNILRCRPPGNRNPSPQEAENCSVFLNQTLEVIAPKYIFCLGSIAATNLLDTQNSIGRLRGKVHDYYGIQVVCTYHPAYLLRNPSAKAATWEDVKLLMRIMGLPLS
jgi:DNA polymerase